MGHQLRCGGSVLTVRCRADRAGYRCAGLDDSGSTAQGREHVMYPDSFFQWLGYLGLVFGLLIGMCLIAFWVNHSAKRW